MDSVGDERSLNDQPAETSGEWAKGHVARYHRQIILPELGLAGQRALSASRVLVVGAGALGSAAALYLAAAGVGTIGIADGDRVDLSNLHRQVLHGTGDIGRLKTASAKDRLGALNPEVRVAEHPAYLDSGNVLDIMAGYDVVVDGSDSFAARYLVNDAAVLLAKPLVTAAILRFEGQLLVFRPGEGCYRCVFPQPPPAGTVPNCAEAGVLGAVAGVLGSTQAVEALKLMGRMGEAAVGRLGLYDAWTGRWQQVQVARDPACAVCGDHPTITAPIDYDAWCGVPAPAAGNGAREVSVAEAQRLMDRGVLFVDVRPEAEYARGHIPGAVLVGPDTSSTNLPGTADAAVVCVCLQGVRSAAVATRLESQGRSAVSLAGGLLAWARAGLPWDGRLPT